MGMIKAKPCTYKGLSFDSQLELRCFQLIEGLNFSDKYKIDRPLTLPVKPGTDYFKPIVWRCDFGVKHKETRKSMFLEVKGKMHKDFPLLMKFLQYTNPQAYEKVCFFTDSKDTAKKLKIFKRPVFTPDNFLISFTMYFTGDL